MMRIGPVILLVIFCAGSICAQENLYKSRKGIVSFVSDAPLELIKGKSSELNGMIDTGKRTFAFSLRNESIKGFNSSLQQEHFYENYIESHKYPASTFEGKIIEVVDLTKNGEYPVRAKGYLTIHGVSQERIIKVILKVNNGVVSASSQFKILLADHNISIPKIVEQKIATEILISVEAEFTRITSSDK